MAGISTDMAPVDNKNPTPSLSIVDMQTMDADLDILLDVSNIIALCLECLFEYTSTDLFSFF